MGIGGHMLGERRLRALRVKTGLELDRAYNRGTDDCQGVVWDPKPGTRCVHYAIDVATGAYAVIERPDHWWSCDPRHREEAGVPVPLGQAPGDRPIIESEKI